MKKRSSLLLGLFALFTFIFTGCKNYDVKETQNTTPVKIGISWSRDLTDEIPANTLAYINSVKKVGAEPVLLPQIKTEEDAVKALKTVDAVIFTGGEDVTPSYYNEKPHQNAEKANLDRDISDSLLLKTAIAQDYPVLGTCRGMQMLNTVLGGTLYQDLPTEYISNIVHRDPERKNFVYHKCEIVDKNSHLYKMLKTDKLTVNSWHHQAVEKLGKGLKVTALSPDGIVEAVELEGATFVVGVQFHPERLVAENNDEQFIPVFEMLRDYGLKNRK